MLAVDLTKLDFKEETFDLLVCSHVLEHIADDAAAMREMHRVLKKGGAALVQVPIGYYDDPEGRQTTEFAERRFYEHCRSYGWDITEKLRKAGFTVEAVRYDDADLRLDTGNEAIFACKK
ncbi:MAG: methyltransferase domain-containing protein [Dehalococcoidales bacterium]|nr:methyltransferase domain-containing protein [Dehalococcoidales bacterium]